MDGYGDSARADAGGFRSVLGMSETAWDSRGASLWGPNLEHTTITRVDINTHNLVEGTSHGLQPSYVRGAPQKQKHNDHRGSCSNRCGHRPLSNRSVARNRRGHLRLAAALAASVGGLVTALRRRPLS
jgi:hypothetical protein